MGKLHGVGRVLRCAIDLAGARPFHRRVEGGLRHPDRECPDTGPEEVERAHGDLEAFTGLAQQVIAADADPVEVQTSQRMRGEWR